jgi:hypothetical protein
MSPKKIKHTNGEWELLPIKYVIGKISINDCGFFIRSPKAPGGIAVTIGGLGKKEEEANARILLAAPKFYKACKKLMDAPHQEHFITRLNEAEMEGIDAIEAVLKELEDGEMA